MQGAIESVGPVEVLRLAAAQAPARLVAGVSGAEVHLWFAGDGVVDVDEAADQVAGLLAAATGTFEIAACTEVPDGPVVPLAEMLAAAERTAGSWADVVSRVPASDARVQPVTRLGGPSVITSDQWRILARVGSGRRVDELPELLAVGLRGSMRVVADLVDAGLVEVVRAPVPLSTPPSGPALPPPPPAGATVPPPPHAEPDLPAQAGPDAGAEAPGFDDAAAAAAPEPPLPWYHEAPTSILEDEPAADRTGPDGAAWIEPEPVHVVEDWDWDPTPATEVSSSWDDHATVVAAHADWDPEPDAPVAPPTGRQPAAEPAAAADDADGTDPTDDELVNRALLFKFLSSVRE